MIQPNGIDSPKRHQLSNKNRSTQNFFFFFLLYIHPSIRNPNLHFFIFFSSLTLRKLCSLIPIASRAIFISAKANSFASRRRITIINHRDQYKPKKKQRKQTNWRFHLNNNNNNRSNPFETEKKMKSSLYTREAEPIIKASAVTIYKSHTADTTYPSARAYQ